MNTYKGLSLKVLLTVFLYIITGALFLTAGDPKKSPKAEEEPTFENIAAPDEKGPYNVGFTTFCASMTGGRVTRVQVYYPTLDPPDTNCEDTYQVFSRPTATQSIPNLESCFPDQLPNETYFQSSPLCAVKDATVASGPFHAIVFGHGGGQGPDYQRLSQLPVHETLASHGFIVLVAPHSGNAVNRVRDLSKLIDMLQERNAAPGDALFGKIKEPFGIAGLSSGGQAALQVVAGWAANNIVGDERIGTMVVYEPLAPPVNIPPIANDLQKIDIPYMVMGGDQFSGGVDSISIWFELTMLATPRIFVLNPSAVHHGYQTGSCLTIDEAREYALEHDPSLVDPNTNGLIDPLTNMIPVMDPNNPTSCLKVPGTELCRRVCDPNMGTAGANACTLWNQGEIVFNALGPSFGGGRNHCRHVGVLSILSLDEIPPPDGDDFTDSPPFMASDAFSPEPAMPADDLVPMVKLYTVAFFKKYLEDDGRYMRYLTPGYANVHDLEAIVTIIGEDEEE